MTNIQSQYLLPHISSMSSESKTKLAWTVTWNSIFQIFLKVIYVNTMPCHLSTWWYRGLFIERFINTWINEFLFFINGYWLYFTWFKLIKKSCLFQIIKKSKVYGNFMNSCILFPMSSYTPTIKGHLHANCYSDPLVSSWNSCDMKAQLAAMPQEFT